MRALHYPQNLLPPPDLHHLDPPVPQHLHLPLLGDQEGKEAEDDEKDEADHKDRHPRQLYLPGARHGQEG